MRKVGCRLITERLGHKPEFGSQQLALENTGEVSNDSCVTDRQGDLRSGLLSQKKLNISKDRCLSLASSLFPEAAPHPGLGGSGGSISHSDSIRFCKAVPRLCLMMSEASWAEGESHGQRLFPGCLLRRLEHTPEPQAFINASYPTMKTWPPREPTSIQEARRRWPPPQAGTFQSFSCFYFST